MASAAARANITGDYYVNVTNRFELYFTPALVLFGTLGNLLSIFVFYKSKLKTHTTSQYLTVLAVSDTLFLLQLLPSWLDAVRVSEIFYTDGLCQLFVYTSYVCSFLSSWLVVAFTIERFVAVLYPLRRSRLFTQNRVRWIIGALVSVALAFNLPVLKFATVYSNNCEPKVEYYVPAARFNLIDTILTFSVPLLLIVVLNGWITGGVLLLERARSQLQAAQGAPYPRSQQRVTRMLLTVSTVFVLFNLPAYTMRIYFYAQFLEYNYNSTSNVDESNSTQANSSNTNTLAAQHVASIFFNTNFGINFILYCLSGQNFRQALRQVFSCSASMEKHGDNPNVRQKPRSSSASYSGTSSEMAYYRGGPTTPIAARRSSTDRQGSEGERADSGGGWSSSAISAIASWTGVISASTGRSSAISAIAGLSGVISANTDRSSAMIASPGRSSAMIASPGRSSAMSASDGRSSAISANAGRSGTISASGGRSDSGTTSASAGRSGTISASGGRSDSGTMSASAGRSGTISASGGRSDSGTMSASAGMSGRAGSASGYNGAGRVRRVLPQIPQSAAAPLYRSISPSGRIIRHAPVNLRRTKVESNSAPRAF